MEFHRLLPDPGPIDSAAALADLGLADRAHGDRPYVIADFAVTVDGRVAIDGRSGPIGDEGDSEIFRRLRTQTDALLVGTRTLGIEQYGRAVRRADLIAAREAIGLDPNPPIVTVTRSGQLPPSIPLFDDPAGRAIVYTAMPLPPLDVAATVDVHRLDGPAPLLSSALRHLRTEHGIRTLLCEGGPHLFGALLQEQLIDELFLTVAPQLAGGDAELGLTGGPPLPDPSDLSLRWALERRGSLYLRYAVG